MSERNIGLQIGINGFVTGTGLNTQELKERLFEGHSLHKDEILELIKAYEELRALKTRKPMGEGNLRMMVVNS